MGRAIRGHASVGRECEGGRRPRRPRTAVRSGRDDRIPDDGAELNGLLISGDNGDERVAVLVGADADVFAGPPPRSMPPRV